MILNLIFSLIEKIITGEAYKAWETHKLTEVISAQNKLASMSDAELDKRVLDDITRQ